MGKEFYEWGNPKNATIVSLHGMGNTGLTFGEFSKFLDGYHIVAFDLPGHGHAEKCKKNSDYRPSRLSEKIHEKLSNFEKHSFYLMGHSLGANLALYYAAKYPEKLKGIILLDGGYITPSELGSLKKQLQESEQFYNETRYDSWKCFIESEKEEVLTWSKEIEEASRAQVKEVDNEIRLAIELDTIQALITGMFEEPVKNILEKIKVPILLLTGSEPEELNNVREAACKEFQQLAKSVTITSIQDAGHSLYREQPISVAQNIKKWIAKNESGQLSSANTK
ncbi:alpha/beta fold hydrolase [Rummeliibacillus pycnus]|uniref:alpha/beta fold hydrolase n=1 Tax=Rummeliibacillus pycnus TaxID=101070 RepID=UPI0037C8F22F